MDYYKAINKAIMEGETRDVVDLTREALAQLYPPEKILNDGLIQGIELVAENFGRPSCWCLRLSSPRGQCRPGSRPLSLILRPM